MLNIQNLLDEKILHFMICIFEKINILAINLIIMNATLNHLDAIEDNIMDVVSHAE